MQVRELITLEEKLSVYPIFHQMYPEMTYEEYASILPERIKQGFHIIAAFDDNDSTKCLGVAGFWIGIRFYCGKFIQIDSLRKNDLYPSHGVGKAMLDWVKEEGRRNNCKKILLDSFVTNHDAHRLFFREGLSVKGYHFNADLEG